MEYSPTSLHNVPVTLGMALSFKTETKRVLPKLERIFEQSMAYEAGL